MNNVINNGKTTWLIWSAGALLTVTLALSTWFINKVDMRKEFRTEDKEIRECLTAKFEVILDRLARIESKIDQ